MGIGIIKWYREKCTPRLKTAFLSTFIIGLLTHIYKFTNTLINHDSLWNFYSDQNMTGSGRWFLSIACGISSYFDLPWLNGLFSIIFISLTMAVIAELFDMENPVLIIICGALLVTFPSVTEIFFYGFTADGYMLALFLSALGVYFLRTGEKRISRLILGGICICLTCAIYQAYVSFSIMLALCLIIWELLEGRKTTAEILKWAGGRILILAASLISYFIIWKLILLISGTQANDYQGISTVGGISLPVILSGFLKTAKSLLLFILEFNIKEYKTINLYGVLNIIFVFLFIAVLIISVIKSKLSKDRKKLLLVISAVILMPISICMWHFTSSGVEYSPRMLHSICMIYIFTAVLCSRWISIRPNRAISLFFAVLIMNFVVMANVSYFIMNESYERSYATAVQMTIRINEKQSEYDGLETIAIVGSDPDKYMFQPDDPEWGVKLLLHSLQKNLLFASWRVIPVLSEYFGLELEQVSEQRQTELENDPLVAQMGVWPDESSVKVIGKTVVIKLAEP